MPHPLFPVGVLAPVLQGHLREALHSVIRVRVHYGRVPVPGPEGAYPDAALQGRQDRALQSGCQG